MKSKTRISLFALLIAVALVATIPAMAASPSSGPHHCNPIRYIDGIPFPDFCCIFGIGCPGPDPTPTPDPTDTPEPTDTPTPDITETPIPDVTETPAPTISGTPTVTPTADTTESITEDLIVIRAYGIPYARDGYTVKVNGYWLTDADGNRLLHPAEHRTPDGIARWTTAIVLINDGSFNPDTVLPTIEIFDTDGNPVSYVFLGIDDEHWLEDGQGIRYP